MASLRIDCGKIYIKIALIVAFLVTANWAYPVDDKEPVLQVEYTQEHVEGTVDPNSGQLKRFPEGLLQWGNKFRNKLGYRTTPQSSNPPPESTTPRQTTGSTSTAIPTSTGAVTTSTAIPTSTGAVTTSTAIPTSTGAVTTSTAIPTSTGPVTTSTALPAIAK